MGPELGEAWGGFVARMALTRSVRDCAAVLQAIQGPMPGDPYTAPPPARSYTEEVGAPPGSLRVGYTLRSADPGIVPHPECEAAVARAVQLLEELGHQVEESRPEPWDDPGFNPEFSGHFLTLYGTWTLRELDRIASSVGRPVTADDVEAGTWVVAEGGREVNAAQYVAAVEYVHRAGRRIAQWWSDGHDLLVTPTIPEPPPPLGSFSATSEDPFRGLFRSAQIVPFVAPFNATGQPAISLPLHWSSDGLPIGVQLVAAYGREDVLIRVASQLEEAQPWAGHRPGSSA